MKCYTICVTVSHPGRLQSRHRHSVERSVRKSVTKMAATLFYYADKSTLPLGGGGNLKKTYRTSPAFRIAFTSRRIFPIYRHTLETVRTDYTRFRGGPFDGSVDDLFIIRAPTDLYTSHARRNRPLSPSTPPGRGLRVARACRLLLAGGTVSYLIFVCAPTGRISNDFHFHCARVRGIGRSSADCHRNSSLLCARTVFFFFFFYTRETIATPVRRVVSVIVIT